MRLYNFLTDIYELINLNTHKTIKMSHKFCDVEKNFRKSDFSSKSLKILMITDFSQYLDNYTPIFGVNECFKEKMDSFWIINILKIYKLDICLGKYKKEIIQ